MYLFMLQNSLFIKKLKIIAKVYKNSIGYFEYK